MPMLGHIVHKERELEEINETIGRTKNLIFQALSLYDEFMEIKETEKHLMNMQIKLKKKLYMRLIKTN